MPDAIQQLKMIQYIVYYFILSSDAPYKHTERNATCKISLKLVRFHRAISENSALILGNLPPSGGLYRPNP